MLTPETKARLDAFRSREGFISIHVSSTRNMDAMLEDPLAILENRTPRGYIPWDEDEEVVLEVLASLERHERGELKARDKFHEDAL